MACHHLMIEEIPVIDFYTGNVLEAFRLSAKTTVQAQQQAFNKLYEIFSDLQINKIKHISTIFKGFSSHKLKNAKAIFIILIIGPTPLIDKYIFTKYTEKVDTERLIKACTKQKLANRILSSTELILQKYEKEVLQMRALDLALPSLGSKDQLIFRIAKQIDININNKLKMIK